MSGMKCVKRVTKGQVAALHRQLGLELGERNSGEEKEASLVHR